MMSESATGKIRIVLADPYNTTRAALRNLMENAPNLKVVGAAAKGKEALRIVEELAPDVLILEPLIDQPPGPDVAQNVCVADAPTRVLVLSRCKQFWMVKETLKQGACGYFVKGDDPNVVVRALRRVAAGEDGLLSEELARRLFSRRAAEWERDFATLTEREEEVMQLVIEGLSNREITKQLHLSEGTIKNHVTRILRKLDFSSRTKLTAWAYRQDFFRLPPPPIYRASAAGFYVSM